MYNSTEIANRIKTKAKEQKVPIKDMLLACDLSKNALSSMISGGSIPKSENLAKIADYLDCSVDYLLGRTNNPFVGASSNISQSNVNSDNSIVSVDTDSSDKLMQEFLSSFKELSFSDKIKAMDYVNKLNSKE